MGIFKYLKDIVNARKFRKKEFIEPAEFIEAVEQDFNREMDGNSKFFFRHNKEVVNIIHKILNHGRRSDNGGELDKSIYGLFTLVLFPYLSMPPCGSDIPLSKYSSDINQADLEKMSFADILEKFQKVCPEAGHIIGQTFVVYHNLKKQYGVKPSKFI